MSWIRRYRLSRYYVTVCVTIILILQIIELKG